MQPSSFRRIDLAAWLGAAHPWPTLVVVSLTTLVGLASAHSHVDTARLCLLALSMLCCQLAVGWTNDYVDRDSDRLYQPAKPVAAGRVPARGLLVASIGALSLSIAGAAVLGTYPLAFLIAGTAAGLSYNLALKNTRISWLPYVVAFAMLPPFAWTSLSVFQTRFLWLYPLAAPLTLAAHLANTLPDAETDAAAGQRGLVVALGLRRSLILLAGCLVLPVLLVLLTLPFLPYNAAILLGAIAGYKLLLAGVALSYAGQRRHAAFRFVSLASLVFVAGWLAAV